MRQVISREVAITETWLDRQAQMCGITFPRVSSRVWAAEIGKALVWFVGLVLLLLGMALLAPESRADSVSVNAVASYLDDNSALQLAGGVDAQLAINLIKAQTLAWGSQWQVGSLLASEDAVLKAITAYIWPGGPTTVTKDQDYFWLVWAQSRVAIDTTLTVGISTDSLYFGEQPVVSTPEPDVALLLLLGLVLALPIPSLIRSGLRRSVGTVIVARLRAYRAVRP
jgi:hypothetical protein